MKFLMTTSRFGLLSILVPTAIFALLSGAEAYGNGLEGILKNSPNALPWAAMIILVALSWKYELASGILVTVAGIAAAIFFNTGIQFNWLVFGITLAIPLLGILMIIAHFQAKRHVREV